ncbi:type I polyketide synthase [Puniceibacterium sediminis]|uniref:Acyl transferase domain-containing protein n=1 Tax=Puniceibacterium sediminis TaxID=1608407 RepID=A0A238Z2Z2_9RHOB|nr:type I polyketide synthase [Puniceibacterium sediminis]SNR77720.1 Acyl transferase domain-containing protein [Puniceibacterium sediminis]
MSSETDIAIVGMAGRFPGAADIAAYGRLLFEGRCGLRRLDDAEIRAEGISPDLRANPNYVPFGGPIEDISQFDADFFGMTPREAARTDPQQRLWLTLAWEALEDAGLPPGKAHMTGIFTATGTSNYWMFNLAKRDPDWFGSPEYVEGLLLADRDYVSTRVSYLLGLEGPSVTVQTACSSSLVAVHLACQSLLLGECDVALAGGVALQVPHRTGYLWQAGGYASRAGVCRPFDAEADGTVFGSGGGVVVLRPLAQAQAAGDRILAVIKGSAMGNDGAAKPGFAAPSVAGQARTVAAALAVSGVPSTQIGLIEAHGTGTPLGDPTEVAALSAAFDAAGGARNVALGSVKGNIGHLDAAAGIAGLIKLVLARAAGQLPASLHFTRANPEIAFAPGAFYVNTRARPWPKRAPYGGVSALGIGGTNAHVVIGPAPETAPKAVQPPRPEQEAEARDTSAVLVLAARSAPQLRRLAERWSRWLAGPGRALEAGRIAAAAAHRRADGPHRLALAGADPAEWSKALAAFATAADRPEASAPAQPGVRTLPAAPGQVQSARSGAAPAWIFSGQGGQSVGMARAFRSAPGAGPAFERFLAALPRDADAPGLANLLFGTGDPQRAARALSQPGPALLAHVALQCAITAFWRAQGLTPAAVLGVSLGEIAAAHAAGCLSLEAAAVTAANRARALSETDPSGRMIQLPLGTAEARALIESHSPGALQNGTLWIAVEAGPEATVIAGRTTPVDALCAALAKAGPSPRSLSCGGVAGHGPTVQAAAARLAAGAKIEISGPPDCPVYPCTQGWEDGKDSPAFDAKYWGENLSRPVLFGAAVTRLLTDGHRDLLEIAPRPQSLFAIDAIARQNGRPVTLRQSANISTSDTLLPTLETLATLIPNSVAKSWRNPGDLQSAAHLDLPRMPLDEKRHWIDPPSKGSTPQIQTAQAGPRGLLGAPLFAADAKDRAVFHGVLAGNSPEWQAHLVRGRVTLPAAAILELVVSCAQEVTQSRCAGLRHLEFQELVSVSRGQELPLQLILHRDSDHWQFELYRGRAESGAQGHVRDWTQTTRGQILLGALTTPEPACFPSEGLEDVLPGASVYETLAARGVALGPTLQLIERVAIYRDRLAAQVDLQAQNGAAPYRVLDAAFQTLAADPEAHASGLTVPTAIAALDLHQPIRGDDVLFDIEVGRGRETTKLEVIGPERRIHIALRGVETRGVTALEDDMPWLHRLHWEATEAKPPSRVPSNEGSAQRGAKVLRAPDWSDLGPEDLPSAAASVCADLLATVRQLSQEGHATARSLTLLVQSDSAENPSTAAARGAAAGFLRTLSVEYAEFSPHLVQLPNDISQPTVRAPGASVPEPEMRASQAGWQVPRIVPISGAPGTVRLDGAHLVTGANGRIGPVLLAWLVEQGAEELLLVLRNGPGQALRDAIEDAEQKNITVLLHRLDLTQALSPSDWAPVLSSAKAPLRGVFHLAGTQIEEPTEHLDLKGLEKAVAIKAGSVAALAQAVSREDLRHMVLFSSMAGRLGAPGLAAHAAASAALSGLGEGLLADGMPVSVLEWGPWAHPNLAMQNQAHGAMGFEIMPEQAGTRILGTALTGGPGIYQIFQFDPSVWTARFPSLGLPPLLSYICDQRSLPTVSEHAAEPLAKAAEIPWRKPRQAKRMVTLSTQSALGRALGLSVSDLLPDQPFAEMNLSSMMALEMRARLEDELGIVIPTTTIWRHPTLERLTEALVDIGTQATTPGDPASQDRDSAYETPEL